MAQNDKIKFNHATIAHAYTVVVTCAPLVIPPGFPLIVNIVSDFLRYFEMIKHKIKDFKEAQDLLVTKTPHMLQIWL